MSIEKEEAKVVDRIIGGLERTLSQTNDAKIKVDLIFPDARDAESRKERPDSIGLSQALVLLNDLSRDLRDLNVHLNTIV